MDYKIEQTTKQRQQKLQTLTQLQIKEKMNREYDSQVDDLAA